jgi:hypothetical protein
VWADDVESVSEFNVFAMRLGADAEVEKKAIDWRSQSFTVESLATISGTVNKPDAWLRVEQKKLSEMANLDMFTCSGFA